MSVEGNAYVRMVFHRGWMTNRGLKKMSSILAWIAAALSARIATMPTSIVNTMFAVTSRNSALTCCRYTYDAKCVGHWALNHDSVVPSNTPKISAPHEQLLVKWYLSQNEGVHFHSRLLIMSGQVDSFYDGDLS